jgi:formate hydrogenlyase subunit 3/multisubunit Na+/H+ antiporter MnhD subunit
VTLVAVGVLLVLLGGASVIALQRYQRIAEAVFRLSVVAGCATVALAALNELRGGGAGAYVLEPTLPGGTWIMGMDELSAWFLLLLAVVGGITTIFGVTYMRPERAHRPVAAAHATWAIVLAAMVGVLIAQSAVLFLVTWEVMAVGAYFLIMFEDDRDEVRRSGLVYLIMTHLGTLGLLAMFLTWGHAARNFTFASFAAANGGLPWAGAGILLLALFGFGIKAGLFPLHFWLPAAHAAAPSHVSALLSGIMLKLGIYGLLRVLTLFGNPPAWWGWTLLTLGLASAVLGVLWALGQPDLKRALAYSSVENIGIILLGIGLGSLGMTHHQPAVALLGFAGALMHAMNHALFKSLLFLGAGVVVRETGTREVDRLGGLARHMPRTALAFFMGSIAIIGLPPMNGFVSEWTLVRGFLSAGGVAGSLRWASLGAAGLGLVGALALACFVRLAGAVFLGQPRDRKIGVPRDASPGLAVPMAMLAAGCASIGLAPAAALGFALRVAGVVSGSREIAPLVPTETGPAIGLRLFGASVLLLILGAWALRRPVLGATRQRSGPTWGCAYPEPTARMQYSAASLSSPILTAFRMVARFGPAPPLGPRGTGPSDRVLRDVARPLWNRIQALALSVRPLQQGRVTTYLQYMIWTVLVLLASLLFTSTGVQR